MDFQEIALQIVILFLIMLAGALAGRAGYINQEGSSYLNSVVINITNPCLIFCAMQRDFSQELMHNSLLLLAVSGLIYIPLITISEIWGRVSGDGPGELGTKRFLFLFGNVAFLGIPILQVIFGELGVFYVAMFGMLQSILMYSYGYKIYGRSGKVRLSQLMNNGLIATVAAFLFFVARFKLPYLLFQPLNMIGQLTIPLILLSVGSVISRIRPSELVKPATIWWITAVKLLIFPMVCIAVFRIVPVPKDVEIVTVILMGMPAALISGALTEANGGNVILANKTVILSNLLVMFTVPCMIWMLDHISGL